MFGYARRHVFGLSYFQLFFGYEKKRSARMPQIIKADLWKLRFLKYRPEVVLRGCRCPE